MTQTPLPLTWTPNHPNDTGWKDRHMAAIANPQGFEVAIVGMLRGWLDYAKRVPSRYGNGIGEDYFLGPSWARIGVAIRELLNGETGRLDCGTLDAIILASLGAEGYLDENGEEKIP